MRREVTVSEALRRALADARLTEEDVARRLGVDPKTVRRWIAGRTPYPRHRTALAALVGVDARDLWPDITRPAPLPQQPTSEILVTYPHRWAVPRGVWQRLFEGAQREIGILAYAGLFLAEDSGLLNTIAAKARTGVPVRIMLGDPDGSHITQRGADEGLGDSLAAKIRNSLVLYRPLRSVEGVEIRLHDTVLYNSIYRADDHLMINPHAYGIAAAQAPVLYVRQAELGDMTSTYLASFEAVWGQAAPLA
jgi:transcriptional regulator with XRE-family HTH domain